MRKIYITDPQDNPVCDEAITLANEAGAEMIYSGVAPIMVGTTDLNGNEITEDTRGYVELPDIEVPEVVEPEIFKQIPEVALSELSTKLEDSSVNSIAEIKQALKDFVGKIV